MMKMRPRTGLCRVACGTPIPAKAVCLLVGSHLADGEDGIAQDGEIGLDPETGTVGGGHEAFDALRRAGCDVERAVAVEVGRRKAELLWRRAREMGDGRGDDVAAPGVFDRHWRARGDAEIPH